MNEESKKNFFIRRNQVLRRNKEDAKEIKSKSVYFQKCLNENQMKELTQKAKIVQSVKIDEKKWNEKKRHLWVYSRQKYLKENKF